MRNLLKQICRNHIKYMEFKISLKSKKNICAYIKGGQNKYVNNNICVIIIFDNKRLRDKK